MLLAFAMKARAQSADGASVLVAPAGAAPAPSGQVGIVTPVSPSLTPVAVEPTRPLLSAPGPAKPARVPLGKRWWFWASLGAATVGVVLAAIFLGPRDPYNGNASPGTVTIF